MAWLFTISLLKMQYLVSHQRNQRRDDQSASCSEKRRQLICKGFSPTYIEFSFTDEENEIMRL